MLITKWTADVISNDPIFIEFHVRYSKVFKQL